MSAPSSFSSCSLRSTTSQQFPDCDRFLCLMYGNMHTISITKTIVRSMLTHGGTSLTGTMSRKDLLKSFKVFLPLLSFYSYGTTCREKYCNIFLRRCNSCSQYLRFLFADSEIWLCDWLARCQRPHIRDQTVVH